MITRALRYFGVACAIGLVALAAACSDEPDSQADPTATPTSPGQGIAVGEPTPPGGQPSATPTEEPSRTAAEPMVEWLTLNHAGAGAVTLVFETNVPTTASAQGVAGSNGDDQRPLPAQSDDALATRHVISLGTAGLDMMWEVKVTDAQGRIATATIESGAIVQKQYWARTGEFAPKVSLEGNLRGTATWSNLYGQAKPTPGVVILVSRKAGCTTAEACLGEPVGMFDGDNPVVSGDKVLEQHAIELEFPDTAHDYQVLLMGEPGGPGNRAFYQVDVLAGEVR